MRSILLVTTLAAALGSTPATVHAEPMHVMQSRAAAPIREATPAAASDDARYALAEAQHPKVADFTGGSSIVIVGSTTALVVLLIILVILL